MILYHLAFNSLLSQTTKSWSYETSHLLRFLHKGLNNYMLFSYPLIIKIFWRESVGKGCYLWNLLLFKIKKDKYSCDWYLLS